MNIKDAGREMIVLSEDLLLGEGNERKCYVHPESVELCVKVNKNLCGSKPEQSLVEYDYYKSLEKRGVMLDFLPKCYGFVETNMGPGLVFERIESVGGRSLNLREALYGGFVSKGEAEKLALDLYGYLLKNSISLSDISQENLIFSVIKNRFFLVDGIGARNFDYKYLLKKRFLWLARWKTMRQWSRYSSKLKI